MAYNDRKILEVLLREIKEVPERYKGYQDDLAHLLGDVLIYERDHAIMKKNVVQKIADQVNIVGKLLHKNRGSAESSKGDS